MGEMGMVESVARAIAKADHPAGADLWDENLHGKDTYRHLARAAIAALREPTETMFGRMDEVDLWSWQHTIDAILSEPTRTGEG